MIICENSNWHRNEKTICPKAFFDNIRQINEAAKLTGRTEDLEWKEYLKSIIDRKSVV